MVACQVSFVNFLFIWVILVSDKMGEIQKWTDSFVTLLFIWDILVSDTPQWNIYELDPNNNNPPPAPRFGGVL